MKASEIRFEEFLSQPKTSFLIPVYQRNYDWQEEQCREFLKDIELLATRERDSHFMGSIVYIKGDDTEALESGLKEYIVIDGQQRITTSILFLKAIYDLSDDEFDKKEIFQHYLINEVRGGNKLKLKPIKDDNDIFEKLLRNIDINADNYSKIYLNYQFFKHHLLVSNIKIDKYFKAFKQLWIVYIELDKTKDDPQLIFESINSTGLSLSEADLIRNFILMDKKHDVQNYLFEEYWSRIEKLLLSENISAFIRDYLTMKEGAIPNQNRVYSAFKAFVFKSKIQTEALLADLLYFAKIYSKFIFLDFENKEIEKLLKELKELKVTVVYPYLLNLFCDYEKGVISIDILKKTLKLIRSYIFRRLVCEYNTNALNKVFMSLHKELISIKDYEQNYFECLLSVLGNKRGTAMFPRDDEFKEYFTTKDIYKFKNKNYLLYALESFDNKELVPFKELTIEHIMPQTLTPKWNIELGDKFTQVHEKYLNNIGNLTLSGYNSELSNKSFFDKKDILKTSGIKLNRYFENLQSWNKEEIEKRALNLFQKIALNIWNFPDIEESVYIKSQKQDYFTLDDNFDATGSKIKKLSVLNNIAVTSSWINCFVEFSKILYNFDEAMFKSFILDDDFQGRMQRIITDNPELCRKPIQFDEHVEIYLESNLSANGILNYLKLIAEKYELESDDVIFYIS